MKEYGFEPQKGERDGGLGLRETCAGQIRTQTGRKRYEDGAGEHCVEVMMEEAKGIGEVVFVMRADGRVIRYGEQASSKTSQTFKRIIIFGDEFHYRKIVKISYYNCLE